MLNRVKWYGKSIIFSRDCGQKVGLRKELIMYTEKEKKKALELYEKNGSVTKVIQKLESVGKVALAFCYDIFSLL